MQSCSEESLTNDTNIRMIALFDNEEVRELSFFTSKLRFKSFMSKNSPQTQEGGCCDQSNRFIFNNVEILKVLFCCVACRWGQRAPREPSPT